MNDHLIALLICVYAIYCFILIRANDLIKLQYNIDLNLPNLQNWFCNIFLYLNLSKTEEVPFYTVQNTNRTKLNYPISGIVI